MGTADNMKVVTSHGLGTHSTAQEHSHGISLRQCLPLLHPFCSTPSPHFALILSDYDSELPL